jgi:hypothetical protein
MIPCQCYVNYRVRDLDYLPPSSLSHAHTLWVSKIKIADSSSTPPLESLTPRHRSTALASPSATDSPARKLKRESFDEDDILAKAEIQLSLLENFGIYIDINEERRRSSTTTANLELEGDNGFEEIELEDDERRERKGGDEEEEEGAIPRTPDLDPDDIDGSSRSSSIISYPSSSSSTTTPTSASPNIHIVSSSPVLYTPSFPPIVQRIETIEKEVLVQQSSEVAQSVGKGRGGATRKKKRASAANSTPTSPKSPSVEVLPIIGTVEWNPVAVGGEGDLTGVN